MIKYNFDEQIIRENTDCIKYDARIPIFGTNDLIPMWVADMDFRTPDFIMKAIKERANHEILGYSTKPKEFYESIIDWIKKYHAWNIEPEWITVSPGVVSGLALSVMAFTQDNDKIAVQPPVYFPFYQVTEGINRTIVRNPLKFENDNYFMDFDDLETKTENQVKMLLLCNPHNPVGRSWTKPELEQLADICHRKNILVVSDEIHSDLVFRPHKHTIFASLDKEAAMNTITTIAPSKTFNLAGLSSSIVIIPNASLRKKYTHFLDTLHLGLGNIFGNIALTAAYKNGFEWHVQLIEYLENNIDYLIGYFRQNIPEVKVIRPEATYLVWLDFRKLGLTRKELNDFLNHKVKIGLSDGELFGPEAKGFQRMNVACTMATLKEALQRLKEALRN